LRRGRNPTRYGSHQACALEELAQAAKSERDDLFQKLVDADPNLAALLTNRDPVINLPSAGGGKGGSDTGRGKFEGKYSPTFLRLEGKVRQAGLEIPINRTRPVAARTDVENGYLQRADNRGRFLVEEKIRRRFGLRAHLHDEGPAVSGHLLLTKPAYDGAWQHPFNEHVFLQNHPLSPPTRRADSLPVASIKSISGEARFLR
jgi:hypothetical protein